MDETNPYSPPSIVDGEPADVEVHLPISIGLKYTPRDAVDFVLALIYTPVVGAIYLCLPAFLVYLVTYEALGSLIVGIAFFFGAFLGWSLPSYTTVTVRHQQLELRRMIGPSRLLSVDDVQAISVERRLPILMRVLWPGFPPKISIFAGTVRDQFRIEWDGGHYHFAPRDPRVFRAALLEAGLSVS